MTDVGAEKLGLIAGAGVFPLEFARAARRAGRSVHAVAFRDLTDPLLSREVDVLHWLYLGEVEKLISTLVEGGVREAVMAGKVPKRLLYEDPRPLRPDARAIALLSGLPDRGDDSILGALASAFEAEGVTLRPQAEWVPELFAGPGPLGAHAAGPEAWADFIYGWPIAKAMGRMDIGQAVVVERGAVLAVEAIEGTDALIRRAGELSREGACLIKVSKPAQDPRFDLPAIGPDTLIAMLESGVTALAFEAFQTIILGREELVARADEHNIPLIGIGPEGPARMDHAG